MRERALQIAVDARCLNAPHLRRAGKSLFELVNRTATGGALRWHLLADRPDHSMWVPQHEAVEVTVFKAAAGRLLGWEQWSLPAAARQLGVDVLHSPDTTLPWWQPVPAVVTIQKTDPTLDTGSSEPQFYRDRLIPSAYHRARAIITISNSARRDILARWPALRPKLHVVSPGVHDRYLEAEPDWSPISIGDRMVSEPYLLYVGGSDARKRLAWALQTWWGCAAANLALVACGLDPATHADARRMVPRHVQDRLHLAPFIPESEMPRLYMRASAVLYPSIGGGFGLPVIEAQAVGTPVLFSDAGHLAELKGPGAVVLPVDDMQSWVRAANLIVGRPAARGPDRIARAWASQYSWDAHVSRTLDIYDAVHLQDIGSHQHPDPHPRAT